MLPAPPGAINPYLSTFQGNGLSYGSAIAPWAAGWVGPDSSQYQSPSPSMQGVAALYGGGAPGVNPTANQEGNSGSFDPVGAGAPASQATVNALNAMRASTLGGVTVSAYTPSLPPMGLFNSGNAGGGASSVTDLPAVPVSANKPTIQGVNSVLNSPGSALRVPGMDVTNLAPVQVAAAHATNPLQWLANFKTDHPTLYQLGMTGANILTGGATALPGMVVNAAVDHTNGQSALKSLLPSFPNLSGVFSSIENSGPASYSDASNALTSLLGTTAPPQGSGDTSGGSAPAPGSIATGGPLPDYAGLSALAGFGNAPVGGYWNRQALKMANPAYGPYAGFGGATPQPINYANPYAPSGITTAGY